VVFSRQYTVVPGGQVRVFTAATCGTEITFNGSDNIFPANSVPSRLYVEGSCASYAMRDITFALQPLGLNGGDAAAFTVVSVNTIEWACGADVSIDNDKRDLYRGCTEADWYQTGGPQKFFAFWGDGPSWGIGYEMCGIVSPGDFDYPGVKFKFYREWKWAFFDGNGSHYAGGADWTDDTSPDRLQDDIPSLGGAIFDLDAPRLYRVPAFFGVKQRLRANFVEFAAITLPGSNTPIVCSPQMSFHACLSIEQFGNPAGTDWRPLYDVEGDNVADSGFLPYLTWDLKKP
jgi:hypothetical protein